MNVGVECLRRCLQDAELAASIGEADGDDRSDTLLVRQRSRARSVRGHVGRGRQLAQLGGELGRDGKFNFLLADGRHLFARCGTKLSHIVRQAPFGRATLSDAELAIDFSAVTSARDRVAVVATTPLTCDETWQIGQPGQLWVFNGGKLRATLQSA